MAAANVGHAASYEVPLPAESTIPLSEAGGGKGESLPESLLLENALWFCRLRWIVVGCLMVFGVAGFATPRLFRLLGFRAGMLWPLVTAAGISATNLGFIAHVRFLSRPQAPPGAGWNLWAQIAVDLLAVTTVVHFLGSVETYAAIAYLFHIVLATIFFSSAQSLGVLALAGALYVLCLVLEASGVLPQGGLYSDPGFRSGIEAVPGMLALNAAWMMASWAVVWFLASRLSAMVRARDRELAESNLRLVRAQQERMRHMLRTTHELKAPFAAIHANAQLLARGLCGPLPDGALDVVAKISRRCRRLAAEIQEMLQLANLQTAAEHPEPHVDLDLAEVLKWCVGLVRGSAQERRVTIEEDIRPAHVRGVEDQLKMALGNVLSNAVAYSHEGGCAHVHCAPLPGGGAQVVIEDHGIGIPADKLPHIFEEYYRTDEAAKHNKDSTGLGLAIVKRVADTHGIRASVASTPDVGTTFTFMFPQSGAQEPKPDRGKETTDGLRHDH